jgi:hypothetical protein
VRAASLLGAWNNDETGHNIVIHKSPLGFEALLSNLGQASVSRETRKGANLELSSRDMSCLYYVTFTKGGQHMNWQLREGPPDKCLKGQFTRAVADG